MDSGQSTQLNSMQCVQECHSLNCERRRSATPFLWKGATWEWPSYFWSEQKYECPLFSLLFGRWIFFRHPFFLLYHTCSTPWGKIISEAAILSYVPTFYKKIFNSPKFKAWLAYRKIMWKPWWIKIHIWLWKLFHFGFT